MHTRPLRSFILGILITLISVPFLSASTVTILISFDGFRHDYLLRLPQGAFTNLASTGCTAVSLIPVNPTKTFPNHWSLATGLYPEHHGIIDNTFYDRVLRDTFTMSRTEPEWWKGEPVWMTAEKHGVKAYTFFWPGSDVEINGQRPSRWFPYSGSRQYEERVDSIVAWATQPQPPGLIVTYFELLDDVGHKFGPQSLQVDTALVHAEALIARLVMGLTNRGMMDSTNIVIVSDHGMTDIAEPDVLQHSVRELAADNVPSTVFLMGTMSALMYGYDSVTASNLARSINTNPHYHAQAIASHELTQRWHINYPARMPDVYVLPVFGEMLDNKKRPIKNFHRGNHGFDNTYPDMHGIFVARGPNIKPGIVNSFSSVDVYNIICTLIGIPPSPNDGDINPAKRITIGRK